MISITSWTGDMRSRSIQLPDPSQIASAPVAKAATEAHRAFGIYTEAERALTAANAAVEKAEVDMQAAADAAAKSGKKVPKDVRAGLKEAREEAEQCLVELRAYDAAYDYAHSLLRASIEANRAELHAAGIKGAERTLIALASARKALENALADEFASFGLLGMLTVDDHSDGMTPIYKHVRTSTHVAFAQEALAGISESIGRASVELEQHRRG